MRDADFERLLASWLADGPTRPPEAPVEAAIVHARSHAPHPPHMAWGLTSLASRSPVLAAPRPWAARGWAWVAIAALLLVLGVGVLAAGGLHRRVPDTNRVPPTLPAVMVPVATPSPAVATTPVPTRPAPAGPLPTPFAPPVGRVAFAADGDLRLLDVATGAVTAVTGTPDALEAVGSWSPDGAWLAYWLARDAGYGSAGIDEVGYDLWRVRADGTSAELLVDSGDPGGSPLWHHLGVSWAPDGARLAATRFIGWAVTAAHLQDIGGPTRDIPPEPVLHVAEQGYADPAISLDGRWVAMAAGTSHGHLGQGVVLVPADPARGDAPALIESTVAAGELAPESIAWTGQDTLLFVAGDALWSVNADGTALFRLTPETLVVRHAIPAPDGSAIAFIALDADDGTAGAYTMSTGGTSTPHHNYPEWLVRADGQPCLAQGHRAGADPLAMSPDGHHVAFFARTASGDCRLAWIATQTPETLVNRWHDPSFYYPYVWQAPVEVEPTLLDVPADLAPIAWGPATP